MANRGTFGDEHSEEAAQVGLDLESAKSEPGGKAVAELSPEPPAVDGSTREQVFEALRRRGAEVLRSADGRAPVCPAAVEEGVSALVVVVELSAAPGAHGIVRHIASRQLAQLTIVLLLRYPEQEDPPQHSALLTATKAFNQLKADGVFWEPRTSEGLEDVVEMWLACAQARATEREREQREERQRHEALRSESRQFWGEVHTIFSNIPQLCTRIGEPEVGGRIGRHHDVVKLLGVGSVGDVFLLRHTASKELKALKAMGKDKVQAYGQVQAIAKEIANLKRLSHQNIIAFRGAAHTPKHVCLLLEYGGPKSLLKAQKEAGGEGLLPPKSAQQLFQQLAGAVAHCHSRGLAHRDLRQENVVVSQDNCTAKIVDLGSADDVSSPLELLGAVPFIAPEVMANETGEFSASQADVWSLGVLFLEMLCGLGLLPQLLGWRLPVEPRPELAGELRGLLADWDGLTAAVAKRRELGPGSLGLLRQMLLPSGTQRSTAADIAAYSSYDGC